MGQSKSGKLVHACVVIGQTARVLLIVVHVNIQNPDVNDILLASHLRERGNNL
jgi:hypothetical protein